MISMRYRILRRIIQGPPSRAPVLTDWVAMRAILVATYHRSYRKMDWKRITCTAWILFWTIRIVPKSSFEV